MDIQKVHKEDLTEILHLQKQCYMENAERYNDYNISPLTQTVKELEAEYDRGVVLKAVEGAKIIGSVRAYEQNNVCYIGKLIVHPTYQNKGIGKALLNEIEQCFKHVKCYELFTGFRDEKNLFLYDKSGYKEFERKLLSDDFSFVFLKKEVI